MHHPFFFFFSLSLSLSLSFSLLLCLSLSNCSVWPIIHLIFLTLITHRVLIVFSATDCSVGSSRQQGKPHWPPWCALRCHFFESRIPLVRDAWEGSIVMPNRDKPNSANPSSSSNLFSSARVPRTRMRTHSMPLDGDGATIEPPTGGIVKRVSNTQGTHCAASDPRV